VASTWNESIPRDVPRPHAADLAPRLHLDFRRLSSLLKALPGLGLSVGAKKARRDRTPPAERCSARALASSTHPGSSDWYKR
jgi:hypothetical protein